MKENLSSFFSWALFYNDMSVYSLHPGRIRNRRGFSPWLASRSKTNGQALRTGMKFAHILIHTLHREAFCTDRCECGEGNHTTNSKESSEVITDWVAKIQMYFKLQMPHQLSRPSVSYNMKASPRNMPPMPLLIAWTPKPCCMSRVDTWHITELLKVTLKKNGHTTVIFFFILRFFDVDHF